MGGLLALLIPLALSQPQVATEGFAYGPLVLPRVPAAQELPLSAFALPRQDWSADLWAACDLAAMPVGTPVDLALVQIRADGLFVQDQLVMPLEGGLLPDGGDLDGHVALRRALRRIAAEARYAFERGCAPWLAEGEGGRPLDRLLLVVDHELPFSLVTLVAWEARLAGVSRIVMAVDGPSKGPWSARNPGSHPTMSLRPDGDEAVGAVLRGAAREAWDRDAGRFRTLHLVLDADHGAVPEALKPRRRRDEGVLSADAPLSVLILALGHGPGSPVPRGIVGGGSLGSGQGVAPRDRALPALSWTAVKARGAMDSASVAEHLLGLEHKLKLCYGKGLLQDPVLEGELALRFTVGEEGRAGGVTVAADSLGDPGVVSCVTTMVGVFGWESVHAPGPTQVDLTVGFFPLTLDGGPR